MPGMVTITASVRESPPSWAVMQRHLIETMNEAAPLYLDKFIYSGGTMRQHGKLDDDYECFINWPLFYIIGGDDKFLDWGLQQFNAITRQWTYQHQKSVHKEFVKHYDMLHLSEGYLGFQYFGLADPTIPENIDRARRFAGFYMNEDPDAPNFDPQYRIIRSIASGSQGPVESSGAGYMLNYGHATLYPIVKDLEQGWDKDPKRREEIQKLYDEVVTPCDCPMNLCITGLVSHAYVLTGDEKYKKWVLDYVDAWIERTKENNGIIPDNIGRTGKIGEYRNGQWWGGFFGWSGRYSIEMLFNSLITSSEWSYLISSDPKYLGFFRSQIDVLLDNAITRDGNLLIPYKMGPDGWYDYRPMEPFGLSHLWHASMNSKDWERIERIRKGTKNGPWAYAYAESPNPPAPGSEMWKPDGTLFDWNAVRNDLIGNKHRLNESPHLGYLGGINPDWPEKILNAEYEMVCRNIERLRSDTYRNSWGSQTVLTQNPIFTNGLAQMTLGASFTGFNGGLLNASVRYFDRDRARPGLPEDVAALVEKLEADRTVLQLVNTNAFETRSLIVQAGAYREHKFIDVKFTEQSKNSEGNTFFSEKTVPVNKDYFVVELPPATTIRLEIGMERFVNKPTYAFPWH
ncbi:MAG TPA: hypothetical protein ENI15_14990 [Spirochaetes bacterium]|nr:hypothetical protein [Spirochaetota bacterium]